MCTIATGGGYQTRSLFTNSEMQSFRFCLPILLTSINNVVQSSDLADRTFKVQLKPIAPLE